MGHILLLPFLISALLLPLISAYGLTVEEIIRLKEAGVEDKTIQMLILKDQREKDLGVTRGMGVKEIERPDGRKDILYFSISTEADVNQEDEEQEQLNHAWEMLKHGIIIDDRIRR